MKGYFITFEGGDGTGKSTQISYLAKYLNNKGYDAVVTREPGGTIGAECIRHVLLSGRAEEYGPSTEALLFAAARADHVDEFILPSLQKNKIVLCDRFIDSTRVYQGKQEKESEAFITMLEKIALEGLVPNLTFILDLPVEISIMRTRTRRGTAAQADRFEKDDQAIQEQRRQAFLDIAKNDSKRCKVIDARQTIDDIAMQIATIVDSNLEK